MQLHEGLVCSKIISRALLHTAFSENFNLSNVLSENYFTTFHKGKGEDR